MEHLIVLITKLWAYYVSLREGPFLLVAVLGNEGQVGERKFR